MKISKIITDKYKLRIPPTIFYDLLADVREVEEDQEPTTKNDLGVREFEEIVVEYPPEDLCTYPEYKGKPYFGIKYKENEKEIVGYGTYKSEVLSQYLKNYFISTTKDNLGVDCISRKEALKAIEDKAKRLKNADTINGLGGAIAILYELPSVLPKVSEGYWFDKGSLSCRCSNCGCKSNKESAYCPNCGAKMEEPQESEE